MTLPSDAAVSRGDIMRRLAELERAVSLLAAARGLEASQIGAGGVLVTGDGSVIVQGTGALEKLYDNGALFFQAGRFDTVFGAVEIIRAHYLDGVFAFRVQSNISGGFEDWAFFDGEGNTVLASDANVDFVTKGRGLSRPFLAGPFVSAATPTDSTASGTFTILQKTVWVKQQPKFAAWVQHSVSATTGEIRWRISTGPDAGTVIGGPSTISGSTQAFYGPFTVPGAYSSEFELVLEGRVATGAGSVAVRTLAAYGRGT